MRTRSLSSHRTPGRPGTIPWASTKTVFQALLLALVARTLLFQPFNMPSGSLVPTLLIGITALFRSTPTAIPVICCRSDHQFFSGRIWGAEPKRGDIPVFKLPKDNSTEYIKRVIGLPGDRIQMVNGKTGWATEARTGTNVFRILICWCRKLAAVAMAR